MNQDIEHEVVRVIRGRMTSASIAEALGLQVFQVTARLASMEKRGLLQRTEDRKLWQLGVNQVGSTGPVATVTAPSYDHLEGIEPKGQGWKIRYGSSRATGHESAYFITPDGDRYNVVELGLATHIARYEGLAPVFLQRIPA